MPKRFIILLSTVFIYLNATAQVYTPQQKQTAQYHAAIEFADAAVNSIAALNSLIKKKIIAIK